jgi:hypothetical protein
MPQSRLTNFREILIAIYQRRSNMKKRQTIQKGEMILASLVFLGALPYQTMNVEASDRLQEIYQSYADLDLSNYTQESVAGFEAALNQVEILLENEEISSQEEVQAIENLANAYSLLESNVQTIHLETVLQIARLAMEQETLYKDASGLGSAVWNGEEVLTQEHTSQEQVDQAAEEILDELSALKRFDIQYLNELMELARSLKENGLYTEESMADLDAALEAASLVAGNSESEKEVVHEAYQNLLQAIKNLERQSQKNEIKPIQERQYGDVNGDGKVDTADCMEILQYVTELAELNEEQLYYGDVTGDGKVNTDDANKLLQYLAETIDSLTPESRK